MRDSPSDGDGRVALIDRDALSDRLGTSGEVVALELRGAPRRDGIVDLDALLAAVGPADLLESADRSGWSYVIPHDLSPGLLHDDGRRSQLHLAAGGPLDLGPDPLQAIALVADHLGLDPSSEPTPGPPMPFRGGLVGALAYELGDRILPHLAPRARAHGQADVLMRVVGAHIAVSRERDHAYVVVDEDMQRATAAFVRGHLERRCRHGAPHARHDGRDTAPATAVSTSLPRDAHVDVVRAALATIARGDAYQVNLAQQLSAPFAGDIVEL